MSLTSAMIEAAVGAAALDILSETGLGFGCLSKSPSTVYVPKDGSIPDNNVVKSLCGDIRISASRGVEKITELPFEAGDVCWHHLILVGRASKVVTETATADETVYVGSHDLGVDILGCSYGGDEGAACWEIWKKCACIFAVIGLASTRASHAIVTTREDE